jgi:hypothetical protein
MKPIKVFYHLTDLPGWEEITKEQLDTLTSSGLLDVAEEVYFNLHYNESSFDRLKHEYSKYDNIRWIFRKPKKDDFEHTTYKLMKEITNSSTYPFNALYFHQKGITKIGSKQELPTRDWRRLMDFWNIERWQFCNEILNEDVDALGCLLVTYPTVHFQGTTRWMTSDYIRTLPNLKLPSEVGYEAQVKGLEEWLPYRMEIEGILSFSSKREASIASLYQNPGYDGYHQLLPRESYALY